MMFTLQTLKELLNNSHAQRQEVMNLYELLPPTKCERRIHCCSMLPEATLLETLVAMQEISTMSSDLRRNTMERTVRYFVLNAMEIVNCPFLHGKDCLIYPHRFFGCRAYGLWSREYYEKLFEKRCSAKIFVRRQWEKMGVTLPSEVTEFRMPYCSNVKIDTDAKIYDDMLLHIAERIEEISQQFTHWHQLFQKLYFSDISFFITSLIFGLKESVQLKFVIVRDIVKMENGEGLEKMIDEVYDIFGKIS